MPMIPAGPYRTLNTPEGPDFPYYIIPFDKDGCCEGPKTLEHLIANAPGHSDIFLFSHGWNNNWSAATNRYEHFINGLSKLRADRALAVPVNYRPLLVGVFWPSQALTWFDSEVGPDMASLDPAEQDMVASDSRELLQGIAAELPPDKRLRFYELAQATALEPAEATELATMLSSLAGGDDEASLGGAPSADDLLAAASALSQAEPDYEEVGVATTAGDAPQAAFGMEAILKTLDPRNLVKPFTVWQMKDRAGKVGENGVAMLLERLLSATASTPTAPAARVHLIGHSFGCKVVMKATCSPAKLPRTVESALLLQPAVSQYAFATVVPDRGVPGGFHKALQRTNRPIMSTFSDHDVALTRMFHISLRRHDDLGELQMAAGGTPSRFGALGGFGPQASDAAIVPIRDPMGKYDLTGTGRIIGVNGTRTISGHGDISNPSTWWALYTLAIMPRPGTPS